MAFQLCKLTGWIPHSSKNSPTSAAVGAHTLTLVCKSSDDFLPVSHLCCLSSLWVKDGQPPCLCINKVWAVCVCVFLCVCESRVERNGNKRPCVAEIPEIPCSRYSLTEAADSRHASLGRTGRYNNVSASQPTQRSDIPHKLYSFLQSAR